MKFKYIMIITLAVVLLTSLIFSVNPEVEEKKCFFYEELIKKRENRDYILDDKVEKIYQTIFQVIIFPKNVNKEEVILNHLEDMYFLTHTPHFIHRHIWVCTYLHDNDIRVKYDEEADEFFFHTGESVKELRLLAEDDSNIVYEVDAYAVRKKEKAEEAEPHHPAFIMLVKPTTIHPTFKREGDGNFYLELVTGSRDSKPTASGNHNWIRLIDDMGNVYSIGMHPKTSITQTNAYSKYPVRFFNSDIYEWVDYRTYYTHTFPLLKEEFDNIRDDILNDMRINASDSPEMDYSVFDYNCSDWIVEKIAKYLSIDANEMKADAYATMWPYWQDYYFNEMSDTTKIFVDPFIKLTKFGFHTLRLCRAAICGGMITNFENEDSTPFLQKPLKFYFDLDMHVAIHPYLFEEYFQRHEKRLYEERLERISNYEKNNMFFDQVVEK